MSNIIVCDIWFLLYEHKEGRHKRMMLFKVVSHDDVIENKRMTRFTTKGRPFTGRISHLSRL